MATSRAYVSAEVIRAGRTVARASGANLITQAGIVQAAAQCYGTSGLLTNGFVYIGLSADSFTESATSTTLSNEITGNGLGRALATVTLPTGTGTSTLLSKTFNVTGTQSVRKMALFTASSGGVMQHPIDFGSTLNLQNTDSFRVNVTITMADAQIFPLTISGNSRYLVDQLSNPFPVQGESSWFLMGTTAWRTFIDNRVSLGYRSIELATCWRDARSLTAPADGAGHFPFSTRVGGGTYNARSQTPDFTTPVAAYWANLDAIINYCESIGVLVQLFPMYMGSHHDDGWADQVVANTNAAMTSYGTFIASRYATKKNIVWMMGGDSGTGADMFSATEADRLQHMIDAMAAVNPASVLIGAEWHQESIFDDQDAATNPLTFPSPFVRLQTYYSFAGETVDLSRAAYGATTTRPAIGQEMPFFNEGPSDLNYNAASTDPVRRYAWWALVGGGIAGRNDGNGHIWTFNDTEWQAHLADAGTLEMQILNNFWESITWWDLVPQGLGSMPNIVVSGQGTGTQYVAAACGAAGRVMVAYRPPDHSGNFSLDLRQMQDFIKARWFNPSTGAYSTGGGAAGTPTLRNSASSQSFTPPGNNGTGFTDWVLVLEA